MEYEGDSIFGRIFWFLLAVPILWIVGKLSGGDVGPD